jgi:hypothetical protein
MSWIFAKPRDDESRGFLFAPVRIVILRYSEGSDRARVDGSSKLEARSFAALRMTA